jgi:predicted metal-dependent hydrolase
MIKAHYNNGKEAREQSCQVQVTGESLLISLPDSILKWSLSDCRFEDFGKDKSLILFNDEKIILRKKAFQSLKIKKSYLRNYLNPLSYTLLTVLVCSFLVIINYQSIEKYVSENYADTILNLYMEDVHFELLINSCTTQEARIHLNTILKTFGENPRDYHLYIMDKKVVNAVALPNNTIILYSGLLENVKNQDELLAILAHELGHLKLKHHHQALVRGFLWKALLSISLGSRNNNLSRIANIIDMNFGREQEIDSDKFAVELLKKNNLAISGGASFFEKLNQETSSFTSYMELLSTHPNYDKRINTFNDPRYTPKRTLFTDKEWQELKNGCRKLKLPKQLKNQ